MSENKESETKEITVEHLRATLLKDIQLQEELRRIFTKILKRTTLIFLSLVFITLLEGGFVIYFVTQPPPASEVTLKHISVLENTMNLEKKFIQKDREDVVIARTQLMILQQQMAKQDSIRLRQDSIKLKIDSIKYTNYK